MRRLTWVVVLVGLWLLAWGDVSVANVLSGAAVAAALLVAFPSDRSPQGAVRLRPLGVLRLAGHVGVQLVRSNVVMARQILRPPDPASPGVVVHRLAHPTDEVVTVVSSVIALSPGTMVVDVAPDSSAIAVHLFHLVDVDAARRTIAHLEELAVGAIAGPSTTATDRREHR